MNVSVSNYEKITKGSPWWPEMVDNRFGWKAAVAAARPPTAGLGGFRTFGSLAAPAE